MKKKLLIIIFSVLLIQTGTAQQDAALTQRLNEILVYTQQKNTPKILDYTYPKLFTIVTRKQMTDAIKGMYETEEFTVELDSLFTLKVHPVFTIEGKEYSKITHNMIMRMKFNEPIDTAGEDNEANFLVSMMGEKYGKENVRLDIKNNSLVLRSAPDMIAVKEKDTWYFANYSEDNPAMLNMLFSKAVQKKFKELQ